MLRLLCGMFVAQSEELYEFLKYTCQNIAHEYRISPGHYFLMGVPKRAS